MWCSRTLGICLCFFFVFVFVFVFVFEVMMSDCVSTWSKGGGVVGPLVFVFVFSFSLFLSSK